MLPYINMANGFNTRNERKFCIGDDGTEMVSQNSTLKFFLMIQFISFCLLYLCRSATSNWLLRYIVGERNKWINIQLRLLWYALLYFIYLSRLQAKGTYNTWFTWPVIDSPTSTRISWVPFAHVLRILLPVLTIKPYWWFTCLRPSAQPLSVTCCPIC